MAHSVEVSVILLLISAGKQNPTPTPGFPGLASQNPKPQY